MRRLARAKVDGLTPEMMYSNVDHHGCPIVPTGGTASSMGRLDLFGRQVEQRVWFGRRRVGYGIRRVAIVTRHTTLLCAMIQYTVNMRPPIAGVFSAEQDSRQQGRPWRPHHHDEAGGHRRGASRFQLAGTCSNTR